MEKTIIVDRERNYKIGNRTITNIMKFHIPNQSATKISRVKELIETLEFHNLKS